MATLGRDGSKLRVLLRTRALLTLRQFRRQQGRMVGFLIGLLVFFPLLIIAAILSGMAYLYLPPPWPAQLLGVVLVALWLAWMILPLIAFNLNEGMDINRLLIYPLSRREMIAGTLLGTLFDYPTYFVLPLFLAIVVGWGDSPALPVVLVALLLSYGQMVFSGQIVLTAVGGIVSSRRFRDLALVATALLGSSCYLLQRVLSEVLNHYLSPQAMRSLRLLPALQWFPPGAAARAIDEAAKGAWSSSLAWLGYAAVWLLILGGIWWWLSLRVITGEGYLLRSPARISDSPQKTKRRVIRRQMPVWLPVKLRTLALKELKMVWRTPQRRVGLVQGLFLPIFTSAIFFSTGEPAAALPPWLGMTLPLYALFATWLTAQNGLGWEGPGLWTLLLTPAPRQQIFQAKGLVLGSLSFIPILLLGIGLTFLLPPLLTVAGLLSAGAAVLVALAVTSLASVLFPFPVNVEGVRARSWTGGGCLTGLANMLLLPAALALFSLPLALPLALSFWFELHVVGLAGSILSVVYGLFLFWMGTGWAGRLLLEREAEVIQATAGMEAN